MVSPPNLYIFVCVGGRLPQKREKIHLFDNKYSQRTFSKFGDCSCHRLRVQVQCAVSIFASREHPRCNLLEEHGQFLFRVFKQKSFESSFACVSNCRSDF